MPTGGLCTSGDINKIKLPKDKIAGHKTPSSL